MAYLVTTVAEKLIEVLCDEAIIKVCDGWAYKTELRELQETVSQVKAVFIDADAKWDHLSHGDKEFVRRLRDVVYDADDVFDELFTLAQQGKLDATLKKRGYIFDKVCRFFSLKNQVNEAYRMSCEVQDIKKRLDAIASDHAKFNLGVDVRLISRRPQETCSYVNVNDIIGRDDDKEMIVKMLLAPNASENNAPDIVAIVGVGGLGKTALAQLVFGDERIKQEFPDEAFRLWVCVSDQDGELFDDKVILCKILELVLGTKLDSNSSKELVQRQFQDKIGGKKFLLVLDDVWNENRAKWLDLEKFLRVGHGGSKIIVTTRSQKTAISIGSKHVHELNGLSPEYSQRLFEMSAFGETLELENRNELVEIGKKIVEKCCNIPLALKVVGSLLYGEDIKKWRSIQESGLANIGNGNNRVLSVLKLSYHNLVPSLKSCFSYCAIYPKAFEIPKEAIITFWLAQGYVAPLDKDQNLEDAAEEHFIILLRRCFFQDVVTDKYGDVMTVKMHDLMHDVAQEVGEEICIVTSKAYNMSDKFRHVCIGDESLEHFMVNKKIRSYIDHCRHFVDGQIKDCIHLRILVLSQCDLKSLPDSIGKLVHLRYLNLCRNRRLEVLCESITNLYNLRTLHLGRCENLNELPKEISKLVNLRHLNLNYCYKLRELPKGISKLVKLTHLILEHCYKLRELPKETSKLVNLRHLNIKFCGRLTSMPSGIDKLLNLSVLGMFVVGYKNITNEEQSGEIGMLKDLKALNKIQGKMWVKIGKHYRNVEDINDNTIGYLKSMEYLRELKIEFEDGYEDAEIETILEKLEPPPNLEELILTRYEGKRIRRWGRAEDNWAIALPFLVNIEIWGCRKLEQLPVLSKLPHLKSLTLIRLESMEYMENEMSNDTHASTTQFFPSLESLQIYRLRKLKGWWKVEGFSLYFPCLSTLDIKYCPNLASNIICPTLKSLELGSNSERLQITYGTLEDDVIKLRTLALSQAGRVKSIPRNCKDKEKENKGECFIEEIEKASQSSSSFLQELIIWGVYEEEEEEEEEEDDDDDDDEPWKSFHHSLRRLSFYYLRRLPKGMQHLTSLHSLAIWDCPTLPESFNQLTSLKELHINRCPNIKTLPESFNQLTSLKELSIYGCPDLKERCRKPDGEDFPKIQHIPEVKIE